MSSKNDFLTPPPRSQHRLLDSSRFRRTSSLSQSHRFACSSTSLRPTTASSQNTLCAPSPVDFDIEDIIHNGDMDKRSESSIALLSRCISPSLSANQRLDDNSHPCSERTIPHADSSMGSRHSFFYPLHEPGERIAQRTRTLRARTTAVVMSLPATVEDIVDFESSEDDERTHNVLANSASKLRRVSGVGNLRAAFRDHGSEPASLSSSSSTEFSKASYELGFLAPPPRASSPLSSHPSLSTLVDSRHPHPQSSGDLKTLCGATLSSVSILSSSVTKFHLRSSLSSHTCPPTDTPPSMFPTTDTVHNSTIPRSRHHIRSASLHTEDISVSPYSGQRVWSCAKISQSAAKRAARRGHHPSKSRVLSNPIVPLTVFP